MEDIRVLEGLSRRYHQLDEKISEKGGLTNLLGLYGRIAEILDLTTLNELDALIGEIQRGRAALDQLQEMVTQIRALKETFATVKSQATLSLGQKS